MAVVGTRTSNGASAKDTARRLANAAKDPLAAAVLRQLHVRLRLWRLCRRAPCKRSRRCRGDELACGARRWPAARDAILARLRAKRSGRSRKGVSTRAILRWSERGGDLRPAPVTVHWRTYPDRNETAKQSQSAKQSQNAWSFDRGGAPA